MPFSKKSVEEISRKTPENTKKAETFSARCARDIGLSGFSVAHCIHPGERFGSIKVALARSEAEIWQKQNLLKKCDLHTPCRILCHPWPGTDITSAIHTNHINTHTKLPRLRCMTSQNVCSMAVANHLYWPKKFVDNKIA
jgi:hypothetical protein